MFQSAELGHKLGKEDYEKEEGALRDQLLSVQYELLEKAPFSVVIVMGGVEGGGKSETINRLFEWMDPRHLQMHALHTPSSEEAEQPHMYRFWRRLPPSGKIGMFLGSWYTDPVVDRAYGRTKTADLEAQMDDALHFERMLTNERVLVIKFWLHLSKKEQKKRLEDLSSDKRTSWRVTPNDWERLEMYDRFRKVSEQALRKTSTAFAPWYVVEATDARYREITIGKIIHDAIRKRLDAPAQNATDLTPPLAEPIDHRAILDTVDLTQTLSKEEYQDELPKQQGALNLLFRKSAMKKRSVVAVFEGVDAAGKGGAIRRVTSALDARSYDVIPIAAPTDEEKRRPYLWRFWRQLPRRSKMSIFDRSWYGRVLVERIEGFCDEDDWMRAYGEINDFEDALAESGAIVVKFWLQIGSDVQLQRFEERANTSFKRFKIGPEDWRNREKWPDYQRAASEMIERTSTATAPWTIIEANDKRHARIKVLRTFVSRLKSEL
jgi:AMP-polyphosphate phosphotransferase